MYSFFSDKTVYVLSDNQSLIYRNGSFYLKGENIIRYITRFPLPLWKNILCHVRILNRLFRLEPRAIERVSDSIFLICFLHRVWILDITQSILQVIYTNRKNWSDPLNFCSDGKYVYWGEYGNNPDHDVVSISRLNKEFQIDVVYRFPKNTIRHIHNVIFDKKRLCFWILTGDTEEKAGIYIASYDWSEVSLVLGGKQQYRAVVGFPTELGLIYATDAVEEENFIYHLNLTTKESIKLAPINGSCIYGTETDGHFIFSTTVEPEEGRGLKNIFSYKLGKGIKNRNVHLVSIHKQSMRIKIVRTFKKDWLPYKLFQYGSVMFPGNQQHEKDLWGYVMACRNYDGKSIMIPFSEL